MLSNHLGVSRLENTLFSYKVFTHYWRSPDQIMLLHLAIKVYCESIWAGGLAKPLKQLLFFLNFTKQCKIFSDQDHPLW